MIAIINGTVYPVTSPAIQNGVVLVENGKIISVGGPDTVIPEAAQVIDACGENVYPGIVEVSCRVGANKMPVQLRETQDGLDSSAAIQPQLKVINAINPHDNSIRWMFSSGVTTAFITPGPACLVDGQGIAVKLRPAETVDDIAIAGSEQLSMSYFDGTFGIMAKMGKAGAATRMAMISQLETVFEKAKEWAAQEADKRASDPMMAALEPAVTGKMRVRIRCNRADDIVSMVKLAEKFRLDYYLIGCIEAHLVQNFLREHHVRIAAEGIPMGMEKCIFLLDENRFCFENTSILYRGGNLAALTMDAAVDSRLLRVTAGGEQRFDIPHDEILKDITIRAAELIGIEDRVGSLEPGKDADVVIFHGDILVNTSVLKLSMVDGRIIYRA